MPELPEAETIVRGLRARVLGHRVLEIEFPRARYFRPELEQPLQHYLGARITDIFRHGKSVILQIETEDCAPEFIVVRLGMTGQLLLDPPGSRHTRAIFHLDALPRLLCFRDQRQFGKMFFVRDWRPIFLKSSTHAAAPKDYPGGAGGADELRSPVCVHPVADPLKISADEFVAIFRKRRGMIKPALMSQQLVVGVGNIYADESLFAARLHPKQRVERLSRQRLLDYYEALVKILNNAIELGGSSISDFVGVTNAFGEFQLEHRVYGRAGEECRRRGCAGIIRRVIIASRSTHFCPRCQRRT
jgi:formamidopyrimidine-DNA glycosylase